MNADRPFGQQLEDLWTAVINLSLPASSQIAILSAVGDAEAVDELALDFDDSFSTVHQALEKNQLTTQEFKALRKLNERLDAMSGQDQVNLWTSESLRTDSHWIEVRRLAAEALQEHQIARMKSSVA